MSELINELFATGIASVITWLFVSFFAALLLGMACETLHVPKRVRPYVVAVMVVAACGALDSPWLLLPLIALLAAGVAWMVSRTPLEHTITIGNRTRSVDYSKVKGGIVQRFRGEAAAIREAMAEEAPAETVELKRTTPQRGVIGVSARW
ncbi:MAG: hypothetical protein IPP82_07565 [Xanthomonadales bacterium]|nr:hypothetical protein [Xanthomonadales bacterium]